MTSGYTIPREKLLGIRRVVVHKDCPDGLASALLIADALAERWAKPDGKDVQIDFIHNKTPEHLALGPEPGLLLCDIAPHPDRAKDFAASEEVIVLDHHIAAREIVQACPLGVYAAESTGLSGASLAFQEVWDRIHPHRARLELRDRVETVALLASIRDTFQREHPRWTEACGQAEVMRFYGDPKHWPFDHVFEDAAFWRQRMTLGPVLLERRAAAVQRDIANGMRFTTEAGTRVLLLNGLGQASDVADALSGKVDLVIGFLYSAETGTPLLIVTARSGTSDFNCAALCKAYGGGGHTGSASFRKPVHSRHPEPYTHLRKLIEKYERSTVTSKGD